MKKNLEKYVFLSVFGVRVKETGEGEEKTNNQMRIAGGKSIVKNKVRRGRGGGSSEAKWWG